MTRPSIQEITESLRSIIRDEQLQVGERLGAERELALRLNITRSLLRDALEVLASTGEVRRLIGRAGGVFVSDRRIERNLNTIVGLPDIARMQGLRLTTVVLSLVLTAGSVQDRRALRLDDGASVYRLQRLRLTNGEPLSLEDTRLPAALFPGLEQHDLAHLGRVARDVYGMRPGRSEEALDLVFAGPDHARLLTVPEGTALLRLSRTSTAPGGEPVEVATELFIGDRMRFHLHGYGYAGNVHRPQP